MGTEFLSGEMKKFWRWMVVMVERQCECTSYYGTVHLKTVKMVNLKYILPQFKTIF